MSGLLYFIQVEWFMIEKIRIRGIASLLYLRRNTTDVKVFREIFLHGAYDFMIRDPKIIIDGGGNIGLASVFFANKYTEAKIYSIEPSDENFEVLLKNTKQYTQVIPLHAALWNKDVTLKISDQHENAWAYRVEECEADHSGSFRGISLNTLMREHDIRRVDILKLDVEGAEREIFSEHFDFWIRRTHFILVEIHDWLKDDCSRTVFATLGKYHFKTNLLNGMLLLENTEFE